MEVPATIPTSLTQLLTLRLLQAVIVLLSQVERFLEQEETRSLLKTRMVTLLVRKLRLILG